MIMHCSLGYVWRCNCKHWMKLLPLYRSTGGSSMNTTMGGVTHTTDITPMDVTTDTNSTLIRTIVNTGSSPTSDSTGTSDSSPSTHIDSAFSTSVTTNRIMSTRDNTDSSPIGVIIGGAIGGVVVMLLVGVAIAALCVMVIKFRQKKEYGIEENDGIGFGNAIYQGSS